MNLQLTGKISLDLDPNSSLLLEDSRYARIARANLRWTRKSLTRVNSTCNFSSHCDSILRTQT